MNTENFIKLANSLIFGDFFFQLGVVIYDSTKSPCQPYC